MSEVETLRETVARLRGPGGCPWDQEQTHESLTICLVEECAELLETLDKGDYEHMREELGDVLLQVIFHAQIAQEQGKFDLEAVAAEVNEKLVRRHPHVFGDLDLNTSDEVLVEWEKIKAAEKPDRVDGPLKALPPRLPALLFAYNIYKQMKKKGLSAANAPAPVRVAQAAEKLDETEAGRQLFLLAAACREAGIDPEAALRRYTQQVIDEIAAEHS